MNLTHSLQALESTSKSSQKIRRKPAFACQGRNSFAAFCFFLGLLFIGLPLSGQELHYTLKMEQPHTHYFEVEMEVKNIRKDHLDFKMAAWAPGSYLIREFARNVDHFEAVDGQGKALPVKKVAKNTWRVQSNKARSVKVRYEVYAYEMSVRTSFLDADHGYLNGTSIFMWVDGHQDLASTLEVIPYKDWKRVSTSLDKIPGQGWKYKSPNYDVLADSPIEIGNHIELEFEAAGIPHRVAMYGEGNYDPEKIKNDLKKVVETSTDVFGENPNDSYLFLVHNLDKGSGGLEHLKSTTLQVNRWTYSDRSYNRFISLAMHEYFHLWNVKRIRAKPLGPFDYENEAYTRLLWVMEGFTSYYDELLLVPSGFYDASQYLNILGGVISSVENQPGSKVLPVSEASFDAWIKAYRPDENSYNTTISYYSKGQLIASLLDLMIIKNSDAKQSLDDVMRHLYQEFYKNKKRGFSSDEMKQVLEKFTGQKLDDFYNKYIDGVESLPFEEYLNWVGIDLIDQAEGLENSYLGAFTSMENGRLMVKRVIRGTSSYEGGLNVNDEVVALDGYRVDSSELDKLLDQKQIGDAVKLTINRDGKLRELEFSLLDDNRKRYSLRMQSELSDEQRRWLRKWLRSEG